MKLSDFTEEQLNNEVLVWKPHDLYMAMSRGYFRYVDEDNLIGDTVSFCPPMIWSDEWEIYK